MKPTVIPDMAITWVSVVTLSLAIIDITLAVNVTLSVSPMTWNESQGSCELISGTSISSSEPFHWIPRRPTSSLQVWIGGQPKQPYSIPWINFVGCFMGSLTLSAAITTSIHGDSVLECSRHCNTEQLRVFYVNTDFCICDNTKNNISLSNRTCHGSACPGRKGGFCGDIQQLTQACLCKYENISGHLPHDVRSSAVQNCDDMVDFHCEQCVNDGRLICAPGQTPKFGTPGFSCEGRFLNLHMEISRQDLQRQSVNFLYGFQSDITHSGGTKLCLAWNTHTNIRISKPCECSVKALCMYNGSVIGQAERVGPEDGLAIGSGVAVGVIIVILVFVCIGVWKYRKKEIQQKIGNCMTTAGVNIGRAERSSDPETTNPDRQLRHSDIAIYGDPGLSRGGSSDDQEGHYDSTRRGDTGDTYDYLGQMEVQQQIEQRLVGDYDTMAAVRADSGTEVTNTLLSQNPGRAPNT